VGSDEGAVDIARQRIEPVQQSAAGHAVKALDHPPNLPGTLAFTQQQGTKGTCQFIVEKE
jgi:hypothetical protein